MRTNVSKAYRAFSVISSKSLDLLVDLIGIEPMTSSMPWKRAPSCATGPHKEGCNFSILSVRAQFVNPALSNELLCFPQPSVVDLIPLEMISRPEENPHACSRSRNPWPATPLCVFS